MLQAIFLWPHWIEPSTLILLLYALLMSHACSHADPSLLHIGVFVTMLVVLSQLVLTWFFCIIFDAAFWCIYHYSSLGATFFIFVMFLNFFWNFFWSIVLLSCILNCWSTVQLAHCFFLLLSLDGGVRCFWWWRDNNATLHFSYLICFLSAIELALALLRICFFLALVLVSSLSQIKHDGA